MHKKWFVCHGTYEKCGVTLLTQNNQRKRNDLVSVTFKN